MSTRILDCGGYARLLGDAEALARVLKDPEIGDFDVRTMLNKPEHVIREAVAELFADRKPEDLLLLHCSCHGVKDEAGELYFAATNTSCGCCARMR